VAAIAALAAAVVEAEAVEVPEALEEAVLGRIVLVLTPWELTTMIQNWG
jgi:hypothetical protein